MQTLLHTVTATIQKLHLNVNSVKCPGHITTVHIPRRKPATPRKHSVTSTISKHWLHKQKMEQQLDLDSYHAHPYYVLPRPDLTSLSPLASKLLSTPYSLYH